MEAVEELGQQFAQAVSEVEHWELVGSSQSRSCSFLNHASVGLRHPATFLDHPLW